MNYNIQQAKLNTIFLVIITLLILGAGGAYVLVPYDQKLILFSESYFVSFSQNPYPYYCFWGCMSLMALFMIGLVINFKYIEKKLDTPLFNWMSTLAVIGYALMALTYVSRLYYMPETTKIFFESSSIVREVIIALGTMEFDKFIMSYGISAAWFLSVGILSVRNKAFNKTIRLLSFIISFGYLNGLFGYFIQTRIMTTFTSILVIIFPVWSILIISYLRKLVREEKA